MRQSLEMLQKSNTRLTNCHLSGLLEQPDRFANFSLELDGLLLDFSRVHLDQEVLELLWELARNSDLERRRADMFAGEVVNVTEGRPALHVAMRSDRLLADLQGPESELAAIAMQRMLEIADDIHAGHLPGAPASPVRHIIHVGIGGSLLGTRLVCEALDDGSSDLDIHFLGSVDAGLRQRLLNELDPAETMVVLVSKSFSTGDTLLHGKRLREWLVNELGEDAARGRLFAVTSQAGKAAEFGVNDDHILYFPDWVGGRFSLWSPVSLSAAALIGASGFRELLAGAANMDEHFCNAPLEKNLPVQFGLTGLWNRNIRNHAALGIMPYDQRLRLLPAYLQQLIMESNGKTVTVQGQTISLATAPLVFGDTGTEAQHSLFQAMHQGAEIVPLNFVGVIDPGHEDREAHDELLANLLAQLTALACGRDADATLADMADRDPALQPHMTFEGSRPSELILLDKLTPYTLGMLLALYEHRVFVESVLWEINAFDQFGVELGKTLAPAIQQSLQQSSPGDEQEEGTLGALLKHIHQRRQGSGG